MSQTAPRRIVHWLSVAALAGVTIALLSAGCPSGNGTGNDPNADPNVTDPNTSDPNTSDPNNSDPNNNGTDPNSTVAKVTLTITYQGQGSVTAPTGPFDKGSQITLTAVAANGWRFDHWEGGASGSDNPLSMTLNTDTSVVAVFIGSSGVPITFYAAYDWIVDDEELGTGMDRVALSADGKKVFFANADAHPGTRKAYSINPNGSGLTTYNLPDPGPYGSSGIDYLVCNADGSRAFFAPRYDRKIFKLENGAISTISIDKPNGPNGADDLGTNAAGSALFFRDTAKIWQIMHDGSDLQAIVTANEVPAIGGINGHGDTLGNMAVAADGTTIAFQLYVRNAITNLLSVEIFCLHGGTMTQLTDDRQGITGKGTGIIISGDGSTIVYIDGVQRKYIAISPDGTNSRAVAAVGINASLSWRLTHDGSKMIWADGLTDGGRIINTDGTGALDLFPGLYISIDAPLAISSDGNHMVFRHEYATFPFKRCLYYGHLNDADAIAGAPKIESIEFSPASLPRGDPNARVVLTTQITAGGGPVVVVSTDELLDGVWRNNSADTPAYFYFNPLDDGKGADLVANDGTYTSVGQPGGKINDLSQVTIRVGVKGQHNRIVAADCVLTIRP